MITGDPHATRAAGAAPVAITVLAEGVMEMMRLPRLKSLAALAAAVIVATAGVAVQGRQQPAADGAREQAKNAPPAAAGAGGAGVPDMAANRALARKQVALIDTAEAALRQLARDGRMSFADASASLSLWGRRRLETLHRAGAGKAEIVAALEKYIDNLKKDEAVAEELHRSARGTQLGVYDVQFRRMEGEIWLNEEKAR